MVNVLNEIIRYCGLFLSITLLVHFIRYIQCGFKFDFERKLKEPKQKIILETKKPKQKKNKEGT